MAQHVAIGALDAGAHHARGKQQQGDGTCEVQKDNGTAHRKHPMGMQPGAVGEAVAMVRARMRITVMNMPFRLAG
ncbi:hypothetical protein GCM10010836_42020 [Aminobacter aminovorans]